MHLPSASQYIEIIEKNVPGSLATLHAHRFLLNDEGRVYFQKGNYAIVFKTEYHLKNYAIRFFLDSESEVFERYRQIQSYLEQRSLYWKVPFEFLDKEVFLDGEYYPALKMDWIDSLSFTEYLDSISTDSLRISRLQKDLVSLSQNLESNGIGHGNLNLKQIRFVKQGEDHALKLIDYDSMFIPSFRGKDSISPGTAGFQHPMRLSSDFSETIDRFSIWVFLTALEAFKQDTSLWENAKHNGFNKEEQILFTYRDLAFPHQSPAFQLLKRFHNSALNFYSAKLAAFCNSTRLDDIEAPQLYEENNGQPAKKDQPVIYAKTEIAFTSAQEPELIPAQMAAPEKSILAPQKSIPKKEEKTKQDEKVRAELKKQTESKPQSRISEKTIRKPFGTMIVIAFLLLLIAAYFVWQDLYLKKKDEVIENTKNTSVINQSLPPASASVTKPETVFTPANITQFLFQLYQSYNKRDLEGILSNYTDSLSQYYDTYAVSKYELTGLIRNLFINPTYYECEPDIRTLQINTQGRLCQLVVGVNETIQANRRSKRENYSSKIEYRIDSSFKIFSEKNIQ